MVIRAQNLDSVRVGVFRHRVRLGPCEVGDHRRVITEPPVAGAGAAGADAEVDFMLQLGDLVNRDAERVNVFRHVHDAQAVGGVGDVKDLIGAAATDVCDMDAVRHASIVG